MREMADLVFGQHAWPVMRSYLAAGYRIARCATHILQDDATLAYQLLFDHCKHFLIIDLPAFNLSLISFEELTNLSVQAVFDRQFLGHDMVECFNKRLVLTQERNMTFLDQSHSQGLGHMLHTLFVKPHASH